MTNLEALKRELVDTGRWIDSRHWCPATSGNLSARVDADSFLITVSGKGKGELTTEDLLLVDAAGDPLCGQLRPSAETLLHSLVYRRFAQVGYVFHTHSVYGTVLSRAQGDGDLVLRDYELQKAFCGETTHESEIRIPVLPNSQDMAALAREAEARLADDANCHAFILAGHGVYTWGRSAAEGRRHVEAMEILLECEYKSRLISTPG